MVCRCGNLDCLEAVVSGVAPCSQGREVTDVPGVVALVRTGAPRPWHWLRHAGRRIGEVLTVVVNLLNPQVAVFGGDLSPTGWPRPGPGHLGGQ